MSRVEISKRLVAINALSLLLTRLLSACLLIWVYQHLLARLSAEQYAPYPVVAAVVLFLQVFSFGLTGGVARYVTAAYAKDDLRRVTEIVSSMMPVMAGGALFFFSLGGLAAWNAESLLTIDPEQLGETQLMICILVLGQGISLFATPFTVGLYVRQKFVWIATIRLSALLIQMCLLFGLLFGVSTRVLWVVVAAATSTVLETGVSALLSRRLLPELRFERGALRSSTTRELTLFGAWMMLGSLLYRIKTSADLIILNKLGTAHDVTSFHVGTIPDRQIDQALGIAGSTVEPALTAMHATDREESLRRAYLRGNRLCLWIVLAVAAPLVVFAHELVTLYVGQQYITAAVVAMLVSSRYPFVQATEMLYRVALAKARIGRYFVAASATTVVRVAFTIFLVGYYQMGAVGAAVSSLAIGIGAQLGVMWPMGLHMLNLPFRRYGRETLAPGILPAVAAAIACYGIGRAFPADSWLVLAADVAAGLTVYVLVMFAVFRPEDRRDVAQLFKRILRSRR